MQYKIAQIGKAWKECPTTFINVEGPRSLASAIGYAIAQHLGCQVRTGHAHGAYHDPNYAASYLKDNPVERVKVNLDGIMPVTNMLTGKTYLSDPRPQTLDGIKVGNKVILLPEGSAVIVDAREVSIY